MRYGSHGKGSRLRRETVLEPIIMQHVTLVQDPTGRGHGLGQHAPSAVYASGGRDRAAGLLIVLGAYD